MRAYTALSAVNDSRFQCANRPLQITWTCPYVCTSVRYDRQLTEDLSLLGALLNFTFSLLIIVSFSIQQKKLFSLQYL